MERGIFFKRNNAFLFNQMSYPLSQVFSANELGSSPNESSRSPAETFLGHSFLSSLPSSEGRGFNLGSGSSPKLGLQVLWPI